MYELMGRAHAALTTLRDERGQGTVEYVGLILLIAVVLAGVVKAANGFSDDKGIATAIVDKLKQAIDDVGEAKKG
jgi:Flp pilus assembly pilin Flp